MERRIAYMRPDQVQARLTECPVIYLPVGPIEWHAPHLPFGTDPLHAESLAVASCERTGGIVWPTLFWGTERERPPEMLQSLGFRPDEYVVGMDFPANSLPSAYCPEETFALLVRELLRQARSMGARLAAIVNGHGGVNHLAVLRRLSIEFNHTTDLRVRVLGLGPQPDVGQAASAGHADVAETSLMMHLHPETVDLGKLPPASQPIRYRDFAIVDGPGFDGMGPADHVLQNDPRTQASAERGREMFDQCVAGLARQVTDLLGELT